jgi:ABC-type ATPase with predicted acetyltransferase domain
MEHEYVDDWSCKECGHTGISEAEDACPECNSTWAEQNNLSGICGTTTGAVLTGSWS